ncbi:hypothetical protein HN51_067261 [Arachis hypogaea]
MKLPLLRLQCRWSNDLVEMKRRNIPKDPKEMQNSKNKKKKRRRKEQQTTSSSLKEASELNNKEINGHNIRPQTDGANGVSETSQSNTEDSTFVPREFDDGDIDEEIDPALQEKLDSIVAVADHLHYSLYSIIWRGHSIRMIDELFLSTNCIS